MGVVFLRLRPGFAGLFLAVETRKVTSRFSKSTFIGLTTYNMVVLAVVFIPFFVVQDLTTSYNKQVILCVVKPELSPSYDSSDEQAETSFKGAKDNTMNEVHMEEIGSSMQGGNFNEGF